MFELVSCSGRELVVSLVLLCCPKWRSKSRVMKMLSYPDVCWFGALLYFHLTLPASSELKQIKTINTREHFLPFQRGTVALEATFLLTSYL